MPSRGKIDESRRYGGRGDIVEQLLVVTPNAALAFGFTVSSKIFAKGVRR